MSEKDQKSAAMNDLFNKLTPEVAAHPQKEEQTSRANYNPPVSPSPRKYADDHERICTIVPVELMNKVRYIATKEGFPICSIVEVGLQMAVQNYEKNRGPIHARKTKPKKGDASKIFNI